MIKNFLIFLSLIFLSNQVLAKEISTSQAIDQIQKSLIFSDNNSVKKSASESAISITRPNNNEEEKSTIDIFVKDNNSSKNDQKLEKKQQLIYNASIAGQYEVAVELSKQILRTDPKNSYAKFILATCYHKLGQYSQAKNLYFQLLKNKDHDIKTRDEIISNLIEVLVEESPDEAIYFLSKLSYQSPKSAYILAGTAMAYEKINRQQEAILLLEKAINMDPSATKYKFNLAIIYDKISNHKNAIKYYGEVLMDYKTGDLADNSIPIHQIQKRVQFINQLTK
ncbi:MAG: tetratricopeptide (TPR) repeat protein [Lentimonas sp.]|jgi:tetratricopeptide (TPR) repeat protein